VTSLSVFKWNGELHDPHCLANAQDLSAFGYFQRSTVKEMLLFVSRTIVKRTQPGQRQSVEHNGVCARAARGAQRPRAQRRAMRRACRGNARSQTLALPRFAPA
jgi:hypothetical protein